MNITMEQMLAVIGAKEVDIFLLRSQLEELRKRLCEAEKRIGELSKQESAQ